MQSDRLDKALATLNNNLGPILHIERIEGGVNSKVYKIQMTCGAIFALKLYKPPSRKDKRKRHEIESLFLKHCQEQGIRVTTKVIYEEPNEYWAIHEWLDGEKPNKMNSKIIQEIIKFLKELNRVPVSSSMFREIQASDNCLSTNDFIANINRRLLSLNQLILNRSSGRSVAALIEEKIIPWALKETILLKKKIDQKHWNAEKRIDLISPSDVGIHNILQTSNNTYFIDFEYAGRDEMAKLIGDWIHRPGQNITKSLEEDFLNNFKASFPEGDSALLRYLDLKNIITIKWLIIKVNNLTKDNIYPATLLEENIEEFLKKNITQNE